VLPALGDMGFTVRDVRIRKACEYMLGHRGAEGIAFANEFRPDSRHPYPGAFLYSCCGPAFYLTALAKVGLASDARLSKSWQLVVQLQREDGGWVNQHHKDATHAPYKVWDRSCPYATFRAANALSYGQDQKYEPGLRRALRFLLWHLSTKKPCEICQFYFHGHHILRELQMFARTNEGMDSRPVGAICKWLMTLYHPEDGAFRVAGRPIPSNARCLTGVSSQVLRYNFYHLTEEDWLTLRIVQVAMSPHHLSALQPLRGLPTCAPSAG
jgi:hypothetical protein